MGLQACVMEKSIIVDNWLQILKDVSKACSLNTDSANIFAQLIEERFYEWTNTEIFPHFGNFMFLSNNFFEQSEGYYDLITKPLSSPDITEDFELRRWNSARCLAVLYAYSQNINFKHTILLGLIKRGNLANPPYYHYQILHLLFYYHCAVIENEDREIEKNSLVTYLSIPELLIILENISKEHFPIVSSKRFELLIQSLDVLGNMFKNQNLGVEQLVAYQNCGEIISIVSQSPGNSNEKFFRNFKILDEKFCQFITENSKIIEMEFQLKPRLEMQLLIIRDLIKD